MVIQTSLPGHTQTRDSSLLFFNLKMCLQAAVTMFAFRHIMIAERCDCERFWLVMSTGQVSMLAMGAPAASLVGFL